jgi:hypothetical protein
MNKKQALLIAIIPLLLFTGFASKAQGEIKPTESTTTHSIATPAVSPAIENKVHITMVNPMHPELVTQLRSKKGGSIKFWEAVSWCETNHDWNDGGYFSGGLGMAQSVWVNYGGREFASRPPKATKEEQIIVANRLAFFGYQTKNTFRTLDDKANNNPFFRPAIGWRSASNWGKQCANWKTRKPVRDRYTEAGMVEWLKTRPSSTPTVKATGLSGKVSSQSVGVSEVKSCPQWEKQLKAHGLVPVKKFSYIMWRESRCLEKVIGWNYKSGLSYRNCKKEPADIYKRCYAVRSYDSGLLQINSTWKSLTARVCGSKFGNLAPLLTAECNLKVAKALLDDGGLGHWSATSGSNS